MTGGEYAKSTTVGWETANVERKVGDVWEDEHHRYEKKEGFTMKTSKNSEAFDEIRKYIAELERCSNPDCTTIKINSNHKKVIKKTGYCINCLIERESKLRAEGIYQNYEYWKMNSNALSRIKDDLAKFKQARKDADTVPTIVNEDGSIEKWSIDGDIEKVKRDLDSDIEGLNELIITFQTAIDADWEIIKEKYNEIFEH